MEKNQNNQGNLNGNNLPTNNGAGAPKAPKEKTGFKGFLEGLHRKYDAIRYSKAGKWITRGLTAATILGTSKVCYDKGVSKGKASVVPTVVTIEQIAPKPDETPEETPAEEVSVEETV